MIVLALIEVDDEAFVGEKLTVGAECGFTNTGVEVGTISARYAGEAMPLTPWEELLARTAIEQRFLQLHGVAWEDRAA